MSVTAVRDCARSPHPILFAMPIHYSPIEPTSLCGARNPNSPTELGMGWGPAPSPRKRTACIRSSHCKPIAIGNSSQWKDSIAAPLCSIIHCIALHGLLVEKILLGMGLRCGCAARHGGNWRPIAMSDCEGERDELPLLLPL